MRRIAHILPAAAIVLTAVACSSIDCPLNSRVMLACKFGDEADRLADSLTVSTTKTDGEDSVLVNRVYKADSVALPMSYKAGADTYYFDFTLADKSHVIDTLTVEKTNLPHFESVDCNPMMFHDITNVRHTAHRISSVTINANHVTYDADKAHIIIYLKDSGE